MTPTPKISHLPGGKPDARHPGSKAAGFPAGVSLTPPPAASVPPALTYAARLGAADASRYLAEVWAIQRTPKTLAKLRCLGGGPAFQKAGRDVVYPRASLDAWAQSLLSAPRERAGGGDG